MIVANCTFLILFTSTKLSTSIKLIKAQFKVIKSPTCSSSRCFIIVSLICSATFSIELAFANSPASNLNLKRLLVKSTEFDQFCCQCPKFTAERGFSTSKFEISSLTTQKSQT